VADTSVLARLLAAQNAHDVEAMVDCFHSDYVSEQPRHPGREFRGTEQVRANWSALFDAYPDLTVEVLRQAEDPDTGTAWAEWRWSGTGEAGELDMAGVAILGIRDGRIAWARLYMDAVDRTEGSIDEAVARMTHTD
jgi:ketosteroid isomerase-like protein